MTTRRRPAARRSRGPRRAGVWFDTIVNETVVNVAFVLVNLDDSIVQAQKKGMTLVRTLIDLKLAAQGTGTGAISHDSCQVSPT